MTLSAVTMGFTSPAVKTGANTGKRLREGASVKDVANETKDKFVNTAKTAGKIAGVTAASGAVCGLASVELLTGKVSAKLPSFAKNLIQKANNSNLMKNFGKAAGSVYTLAGGIIKTHPLLSAALMTAGTVGSVLIGKAVVDHAKNEGKIEQKYDDIIKLKNSTTDILA